MLVLRTLHASNNFMRCPAVASLALTIISCRRCGWRRAKSFTLTTPLASSRDRNAERRPHRARKFDRVFGRAAAVATERSVAKGFTQGCGCFLRVLLFPSPLSSGAGVPAVEAQQPAGMGVRSVPASASKWRPCQTLREEAVPPGCYWDHAWNPPPESVESPSAASRAPARCKVSLNATFEALYQGNNAWGGSERHLSPTAAVVTTSDT
jgi:hypothetical protein